MRSPSLSAPSVAEHLPTLGEMFPVSQRAFEEWALEKKRRVHFALGECGLLLWRRFTDETGPLFYDDRTADLHHKVDLYLPWDAMRCAQEGTDYLDVSQRYADPMIALVEGDWRLPSSVAAAYRTVHDLFQRYALNVELDDWFMVRQAFDMTPDEEDVEILVHPSLVRP